MSDYKEYTVLDGTNPTLDASDLSYEFEKARINGATDEDVKRFYFQEEKKIKPLNFTYLSSFRDPVTGTSGVAFKDEPSGKTIIAFTGTNLDSDSINDAVMTDGLSIAFGTGHHYGPAYQFYEKVMKENGLNPEDVILTGHSLGENIAQRVALKYNVPETIVYNAAPLYIPSLAVPYASNIFEIKRDRSKFTGNITRITTKQDPLNNISDLVSGVYVGKEYVIPDSGGHMMEDLRAVAGDIKYTIAMDNMKRNMDQGLKRVQSKKDRFKVNDIGTASPNGLSNTELIALDSEQALVVASGLSTTSSATVDLIAAKGTSAVDKALTVYKSLGDVPFGFLLSSDEVRETYNECNIDYGTVVEAVDSHCRTVKKTAKTVATSFTNLEKKIKAGIEQTVQKDKELQGLIAHG
ncbi:hypothetical protein [Streptococcus oralis]|uniref:hypothetical protein n=1 Tax=Streptococcus oralis TaxID=1303 RepID=UPI0022839364|nr:hypothetical protein [Streptococcus oralis]MCY7081643.1 hypothetical protein [Streptococcus oralis]